MKRARPLRRCGERKHSGIRLAELTPLAGILLTPQKDLEEMRCGGNCLSMACSPACRAATALPVDLGTCNCFSIACACGWLTRLSLSNWLVARAIS